MDESQKTGTVVEAIFGIIIIFLVLIFLLYKFGTNNQSVQNPDQAATTTTEDYKTQLLDQLNSPDADSGIYNKYLKQVYDSQTGSGTKTSVEDIVGQYAQELQSKTQIPEQNISLQNVSTIYNHRSYTQNFENLFSDLKKNGATTESRIIIAQISTSTDTLMPLASYDKENLLRIASDYEIFADKLQILNTPTTDAAKAQEIAKSAMNVSYILRQMSREDDQKIYTLWITKYAQNMSAIITLRYALQR